MKALLFSALLFSNILMAQVGIGTTSPDASASLDITSTSSGVLIPRMTEAQRTAISTPATGLLIYQIDNTSGFWYYNGTVWVSLSSPASNNSWELTGNMGTDNAVNFIGTTDDVDLIFRRNNVISGRIGDTNSALGKSALSVLGVNADYNTAIGWETLQNNVSAHGNTAIGARSLAANSTGTYNIAIGYGTMQINDMGDTNIAIGLQSMRNANGSNSNIAIGANSLKYCSSGQRNVAIGSQTMVSNTSGYDNIGMGYYSLYDNIDGQNNIALGTYSMQNRTTGSLNIGLGRYTLRNNVGNENTALGHGAMFQSTSGEGNTAVGRQALNSNLTGSYNVALGARAMENNNGGDLNVVVGWNSDVGNNGNNNTIVGSIAGGLLGNNNIIIGYQAVSSADNISNEIRLGNTAITSARVQVGWTITSDLKWKEDVRSLPLGLTLLSKLRPVDYLRKNDVSGLREIGFIAQEVENVLKELKLENMGLLTKDGLGNYELRYNDLIGVLVKATQEQQETIQSQKEEIDALKDRLFALEDLVSKNFEQLLNN